MEDNATKIGGLSPLTVAIIAIISAVTVLLIYHFLVVRLCSSTVQDTRPPEGPPHLHFRDQISGANDLEMSIETSIAELLPAYKYTKDIGLVSKTEDRTCAVCLCEFVEGEDVRILPECLHPFHVPCIDMWLHSHSSCPLCRADTPNRAFERQSDVRLTWPDGGGG